MMMIPGFTLLFGMHVYANHNALLLNSAIYIDINGTDNLNSSCDFYMHFQAF